MLKNPSVIHVLAYFSPSGFLRLRLLFVMSIRHNLFFLSKWWSRPFDLSNYSLLFVECIFYIVFRLWNWNGVQWSHIWPSLYIPDPGDSSGYMCSTSHENLGLQSHVWREALLLKVLINISLEHQRNWECHFLFLIFMRWSVGDDSYVLSPESEARVRVKYALITLHRLFLSFPGATTHTCRVPSATAKECKRLKIAHPGLDAAFKIRTLGCTTGFRLSVYSKWWANDAVAELSGGYSALVSKIAQWQVVNLSARRTEARSLEEDTRTVLRFKCGSAFKYLQV